MEFALHIEELILNIRFIKIRNRWEKPDPSKKPSNLRNTYLCIISHFKSTKEEDDNLQEEVSGDLESNNIVLISFSTTMECPNTFGTIVPYQKVVHFSEVSIVKKCGLLSLDVVVHYAFSL